MRSSRIMATGLLSGVATAVFAAAPAQAQSVVEETAEAAATEAEELSKIYKLDVVAIPTNMPSMRKDESDFVYKTEIGKMRAVVEEILIVREGAGEDLVQDHAFFLCLLSLFFFSDYSLFGNSLYTAPD